MRLIVTGGAGFIGSAVVRHLLKHTGYNILNIDKLTYASNLKSLESIGQTSRYRFSQTDICDAKTIAELLINFKPSAILHLAAESHVDRSIDAPVDFIQTNLVGTYTLLDQVYKYSELLPSLEKDSFRFYHVSTDEVYGDLDGKESANEDMSYAPSSPYSASKAGADHLVRAWNRTYGLPVLISNCSNNYGPYQFPEKLIPLMILNAINRKQLPVYGNGLQIRDWLYVDDHAEALRIVLEQGIPGETYNISGNNEVSNIDVVLSICEILEKQVPEKLGSDRSFKDLISYVEDRPGHDKRYALNANKLKQSLGWIPKETFQTGLIKTVEWYLRNNEWIQSVKGFDVSGRRVGLNS